MEQQEIITLEHIEKYFMVYENLVDIALFQNQFEINNPIFSKSESGHKKFL